MNKRKRVPKKTKNPSQIPKRRLRIRYEKTASLTRNSQNPRVHSENQIQKLVRLILRYGFLFPIAIDSSKRIIAGHGRLEAAIRLGMESVPTIQVDGLSKEEIEALAIADNRMAELATWDKKILGLQLQNLIEFDFDVEIIGFDPPEIDYLIGDQGPSEDGIEEEISPETEPDRPVVSSPGDLWQLGPHRLLCRDAIDLISFTILMSGTKAQMVFIDPPYNVPIRGHVSGLGKVQHREFSMASGELSPWEFISFLQTTFRNLAAYSVDGSIHFICMDWRHIYELMTAGRSVYTELKNMCVWRKSNAGMGSFYRSQHELVFVYKNGTKPHVNNVQLGKHGRNRSNVWDYHGVNTFRPDRLDELEMHPTVKPLSMVADALLNCSERGGIVLDCFAGSGTTIVAAEKTGRIAYALELDPGYVDVSIRRWENFTGEKAVHSESGLTFGEIQEEDRHER